MRKHLPAVTIAIGILTSACLHKPQDVWVANKVTPVYASESGTEARILFSLTTGDTCTPLRGVVMKEYLHTEIQCKNGRGWTIDKQNFDIKSGG